MKGSENDSDDTAQISFLTNVIVDLLATQVIDWKPVSAALQFAEQAMISFSAATAYIGVLYGGRGKREAEATVDSSPSFTHTLSRVLLTALRTKSQIPYESQRSLSQMAKGLMCEAIARTWDSKRPYFPLVTAVSSLVHFAEILSHNPSSKSELLYGVLNFLLFLISQTILSGIKPL